MVNNSQNKQSGHRDDHEYDERYDSHTIFNSYKTHLVLLLAFVLFVFIIVFSLLGNSNFMQNSKPWLFAIEIVLWVILISIIVLNIKTIKSGDIDFTQQLINLFGYNDPEVKVNVHKDDDNDEKDSKHEKKETKCADKGKDYWFTNYDSSFNRLKHDSSHDSSHDSPKKPDSPNSEVFHIPTNIYKYSEADNICKLFDSRLATYDEVEQAYQNGGSWCSYGWSSDQMALFPTQKEIYNHLKKIPGHEHDCGRPGINGGYIKNKDMKFGINCYGKKPYITSKDKEYIKQHSYSSAFKKINEKKEIEKQKKINNLLVAPFNKNKWSEL
jgi:hypothetical protein